MRAWLKQHRALVGYLVLAIGMTVAVSLAVRSDRRGRQTTQQDIARNCVTGQRSWDALSGVIHTAYESQGFGDVDVAKLPPRTRQLLLDLAPLLKEPPRDRDGLTTKERLLKQIGPRPQC